MNRRTLVSFLRDRLRVPTTRMFKGAFVGGSLLGVAASAILVHPAAAAQVIDQQQPTIDAFVGGLAVGGASDQMLAQVVTAGISGQLTGVRLPVACESGALVLEIQGVTGSEPNGVVSASVTIPAANLPTIGPTFRTLTFTTPAFVVAGGRFAIAVRSTGS